LLCAFFELSTLLFFAIFFQGQKEKRKYFFLSLISFALALLSKESSSVLPLILFAYALIFPFKRLGGNQNAPNSAKSEERRFGAAFIFLREGKHRFWQAIRLSLPFFIVFAVYFWVRLSLKISKISSVVDAKDYFCGILTFVRSLGTYVRILIFPVDLHFDRIRPVIYNLLSPEALITVAVAISGIILLVKYFRRIKPEILFLFIFAFLRFLPLSQIIPIRSQAGYICIPDHFLYVPSVGLLALMVLFFSAAIKILGERKQATKFFMGILAGGWILFLSLATIEQNIYAANEIAMCQRTLSFTPNHVRTNTVLGLRYAADQDFKNAEKYFQRALDYEPANARARLGLGTAFLDQNLCWEGLAEYDKILDIGTFKVMMEGNKDLAYRKLTAQYEAMLKKNPGDARIYYSLGVVDAKKGDFEKAIQYFKDALQRDPQYENARANLCNSYKALGRTLEAKECFLELEKKEKRIK
jgi:superkiller protein 3